VRAFSKRKSGRNLKLGTRRGHGKRGGPVCTVQSGGEGGWVDAGFGVTVTDLNKWSIGVDACSIGGGRAGDSWGSGKCAYFCAHYLSSIPGDGCFGGFRIYGQSSLYYG